MSNIFDRFRRFFQRHPKAGETQLPVDTNGGEMVDEDSVTVLMQLIEKTNEGEYSCAETFDLLDEYVELVADGQNVALLMPLVKKHVEHCPDCGPRFEILLDILQNG